MKKIITVVLLFILSSAFSLTTYASQAERKGSFRASLLAPGLFAGNEGIGTMMSFGGEGEYFFLENLSASFRIEEATDFNAGKAPHSVLTFVARARYIFDIGDSGRWALYGQAGGGGALLGKSNGGGDFSLPGGGFWYQFDENWFLGADCNLHILIADETAVGFGIAPFARYQF